MSIIRVSVKTFHTSDDGVDVTPSLAGIIDLDNITDEQIAHTVRAFARAADVALEGIPLSNVRHMTREEVDEFEKSEKEDNIVLDRTIPLEDDHEDD